MIIIFRGKNQLIQSIIFFTCLTLLAKLLIPIIYYSEYSNSISIYFVFGLSVQRYLDFSHVQTLNFNFSIIDFILNLILIGTIVLLIIILVLFKKLKKGGVLGLGIPTVILLIINPIFMNIYYFIEYGFSLPFNNYSIYVYGFSAAIIVLGLLMILKERRISYIRSKLPFNQDREELKINKRLKYQIIRLFYILVCGSILYLLLFPYIIEYHSSTNTISTTYFFGLTTRIDLDTLGLPVFRFSFYNFIIGVPLIAATILLIILLVLHKTLNKGGILGLGITCVLLMIASPIFMSIFSFLLSVPNFYFNLNYLYIPSLSGAIIVLGLIEKVKDFNAVKIGINKVAS